MLKRAVEAKGIEVLLNVETARFVGDAAVEGVVLKDGRIPPADLSSSLLASAEMPKSMLPRGLQRRHHSR